MVPTLLGGLGLAPAPSRVAMATLTQSRFRHAPPRAPPNPTLRPIPGPAPFVAPPTPGPAPRLAPPPGPAQGRGLSRVLAARGALAGRTEAPRDPEGRAGVRDAGPDLHAAGPPACLRGLSEPHRVTRAPAGALLEWVPLPLSPHKCSPGVLIQGSTRPFPEGGHPVLPTPSLLREALAALPPSIHCRSVDSQSL
ncbi:basic proline-rich protein-like [Dipodomys spectabilis]|uniref:basic proline-rich protein-like n=1 Tax=Dipodomys spectabilis TaxID=105255 RepID=UPI001C539076|nr:basic proline-rich protein-like [Dipodomys spectabilis]